MTNLLMLDLAPGPPSGATTTVVGIVLVLVAVLLVGFVIFIRKRKRGQSTRD
jgi:LPXTG-motif cell wall-anchored protein